MKKAKQILRFIIAITTILTLFSFQYTSDSFDTNYISSTKLQLFKKKNPTAVGVTIGSRRQDVIKNLGSPSYTSSYYSEMLEKTVLVDHYGDAGNTLDYDDDELIEIYIAKFSAAPFTIGSSSIKLSNTSNYAQLYGKLQGPEQSSFIITHKSEALDMSAVFFYKSLNGHIKEIVGFNISYY